MFHAYIAGIRKNSEDDFAGDPVVDNMSAMDKVKLLGQASYKVASSFALVAITGALAYGIVNAINSRV